MIGFVDTRAMSGSPEMVNSYPVVGLSEIGEENLGFVISLL